MTMSEHQISDTDSVIASDTTPEAIGCHGDREALANGAGG